MKWNVFLGLVLLGSMVLLLGQASATVSPPGQDRMSFQVLHVQAIAEALSPEGIPTGTQLHEFWFDPNTA